MLIYLSKILKICQNISFSLIIIFKEIIIIILNSIYKILYKNMLKLSQILI